jgi:hypothetical protein
MKVKLTLLDKLGSVGFNQFVEVYLNDGINEPIGTCEVLTDTDGKHFGNLILDKDIDPNVYFYYRNDCTTDGIIFWFSGLHFTTEPLKGKITNQLKEMLV